ncbi:MAG: RNA polymerase sigma factor [Clostridiales bacterium]|nr:RNA polymerase sigma factor [Clostridiales bacterium]
MTEIYNRNVLSVYRLCFSYLKNVTDTEDIVQETFVKAFMRDKAFENERHEKGWLIMTAGNMCKDLLSHWWRKNRNLDNYETLQAKAGFDIDETFIEIMKLPPKYKTVIYMYYYEEYSTREISEILKKNKSTVCSLLKRGREILKERLGENNEE